MARTIGPRYDDPAMDEWEPTEADMLEPLDAYGHLKYAVGEHYASDPDLESSITIAADFRVYMTPWGETLVAYHVVYDDELGGFIDTVASGVFDASELDPLNKNTWFPVESVTDAANENLVSGGGFAPDGFISYKDVEKMQKKWTKDLVREVIRARKAHEGDAEIPWTFMD